ncbi:MAG: EF-P lysine aminoacylase GenX [Xanthomonadales bacterium]|nr:EF-P lysine aminoacylase GenX [Xanthomonadales bacterium]
MLKQRAFLMRQIREFFHERNVLEVETPILSSAGNTDVNIESFTSESINRDFPKSYLRTSPEFPLKRLLCSGSGDIFELGKVFRKGETSKTHNVEFTMLEWYRIGFNYLQLMDEVNELLISLMQDFGLSEPQIQNLTFNQCFEDYLEINLSEISTTQLNQICRQHNYDGSELNRDEALDFLFSMQIQPRFPREKIINVTQFPASQAALSMINPEDNNTSLRFETYFNGYELANGYQELTDAVEQEKRFNLDNAKRKNAGWNEVRMDKNLLTAMQHGMPDCSGVALGVDRLLMLLLDRKQIDEVLSFHSKNA